MVLRYGVCRYRTLSYFGQKHGRCGRFVGKVDTHVLEGLVVDNYFFGVASVSTDGAESPVVFPGHAGSFGGYVD